MLALTLGFSAPPTSSGPSYSSASLALFDRMAVEPDDTRKGLIDDLIGDLTASGIWDLCDAIHVFAAHTSQAALLNWKGDTYNGTAVNAPTFTTDRGFTGNGTNQEITTGAAANALTKFQRNSAHISAWARENDASEDRGIMGSDSSSIWLFPKSSTGEAGGRINDGASIVAPVGTAIGHVALNRSGAALRQVYKDGAEIDNDTQASTAPAADSINYLRAQAPFWSANQIAFGSIGASLTPSQHSAFYTAVLTYLQGVGAA